MHLELPLEVVPPKSFLARTGLSGPTEHTFAITKNAIIAGDWETVDALLEEFGTSLYLRFENRWLAFLQQAIELFAKDHSIKQAERQWMRRFTETFEIEPVRVHICMRQAFRAVFETHIRKVVADKRITAEELSYANRLCTKLGLTPEEGTTLITPIVTEVLRNDLDVALADGLLSPEEDQRISQLLAGLQINNAAKIEVSTELSFARSRWSILYGQLPTCECPLRLPGGELAHYRVKARWYEMRKVRSALGYAGLTGSIRIAKGLSFRYGSLRYTTPSVDQLQQIDDGELVLTNKRLFFLGSTANRSIPWKQVLAVNIHSHNTFEIEKPRGRSPVIDAYGTGLSDPLLVASFVQRLAADPQH